MSLLGIDIGTTGCKASAFSLDGRCLAQAYREYPTLRSQPGWAELDSNAVWARVGEVIAEVAAKTASDPIAAIGTSSLGEATVPLTRDRRIAGNSILCIDPRGAGHARALEEQFGQEAFYRINPNLVGPQYSLPKLLWLRDNRREEYDAAELHLLWGDAVAFLLGADPVASSSLANRTLLFDLARNDWSDELLAWSGIPRERLGRVVSAGRPVGTVSPAIAEQLGLSPHVPIVAGGHDQCCNALGCGCIEAGRAACGIGTFECIAPVYAGVADSLDILRLGLNIEHHVVPDLFVSFIFNQAGTLVRWFRDTFAAGEADAPGGDVFAKLNRELPAEPTALLVLPHFETPVSPRLITDSAGAIVGLRTSTTRGEILKAIMECATLYFVDSIEALKALGADTTQFVVSGGGARSDAWLQIKADIFGVPYARPCITEASVLGAAMLAGIGTGAFADARQAAGVFVQTDRVFEPDDKRHAVYREKLEQYRRLYPAIRDVCGGGGAAQ